MKSDQRHTTSVARPRSTAECDRLIEMQVNAVHTVGLDEARAARQVLGLMEPMTRDRWQGGDGIHLLDILNSFGPIPDGARGFITWTLYIEFQENPEEDADLNTMQEAIREWEHKIYRLAGHVALGVMRANTRLSNAITTVESEQ